MLLCELFRCSKEHSLLLIQMEAEQARANEYIIIIQLRYSHWYQC